MIGVPITTNVSRAHHVRFELIFCGHLTDELATITFCNDKDLKGDCITEEIDLKKLCNKLPDSNAKGDKGSSVKVES